MENTGDKEARNGKAGFDGAAGRPVPLAFEAAGVPDALRLPPQWVCWRYERSGDKWAKVPIAAASGAKARVNDAATWRSFDDAAGRLTNDASLAGVGFVFADGDGLCGVDLDDAVDPATGGLKPWAERIVGELGTYTEASPSGTGVKLFLRGRKPQGRCKTGCGDGRVEVYDRGRWFAVTGRPWPGTPAAVEARQGELDAMYARVFKPPAAGPKTNGRRPFTFTSGPSATDRAAAYLDRCPAAVSGQGGHDQTFAAARAVVYGFDLGPEAGFDLLWARYNPRCSPPWSEQELRHKCREAHSRPFDKERGYLLNEGAAPFGSRGPGREDAPRRDDAGKAPAAGPAQPASAYDVIAGYFREKYAPQFRRGEAIYSGRLGREVRRSEGCCAPGMELVNRLAAAHDAPKDKNGVVRERLPRLFRDWAPSAWVDLIDSLAEEAEAAEIDAAAEDDFRRRVGNALLTPVKLGVKDESGGRYPESRSLLDWLTRFATSSRWANVRSLTAWSRKGPGGVEVAIRPDVFSQLHCHDLAVIPHRRFAELAERYGVGARGKAGGKRAIFLAAEFLEALREGPKDLNAETGRMDADGASGARACETGVPPSTEGPSP